MKLIKRELRYIRHRICRNIYYADHCPISYRRNYRKMASNLLGMICMCVAGLCFGFILMLMA